MCRQLLKYRKGFARSVFYVVRAILIARQRIAKHIPVTTNTSIARQWRCKHAFATVEEKVFSMCSLREYISSPVVSKKSVIEREGEWSESSVVKEEDLS
jgi:hypothetical protein